LFGQAHQVLAVLSIEFLLLRSEVRARKFLKSGWLGHGFYVGLRSETFLFFENSLRLCDPASHLLCWMAPLSGEVIQRPAILVGAQHHNVPEVPLALRCSAWLPGPVLREGVKEVCALLRI